MQCPKCQFDHALQTTECLRCGVIFSKYVAAAAAAAAAPGPALVIEPPPSAEQLLENEQKARREFYCRIAALPAALLLGWLVVQGMPLLSAFLRMWTHESGHAVAAWLCGFMALPTAWFTIVSPERHRLVSLLVAGGIGFGGYAAWRFERWFWVVVSGGALFLLLLGNLRSDFQAHALITFFGDGGSFVVATVLMATFYARPESAMYRKQLRWGFLLIGAIAFVDTYSTWAGGFEKIANWLEDTDERGPSDVMLLTTMYGWKIGEMQARFLQIAHVCFVAMAAMYAAGIVQARQRLAEVLSEAAGQRGRN